MRKTFFVAITAVFFVLSGCGGSASSAETPESIAKKWCELNDNVRKAETDTEKEEAKDARKKFEDEMDAKYKDNKEFYDKIMAGAKECDQ